MRHELRVNGAARPVDAAPLQPLLDVLRDQLGLTGAKRGCDGGECGSCTVLMDGRAVCSCLVPICQASGAEITTIEGLAAGDELQALQAALVEARATECGFCMPGMVLAATAHLESNGESVLQRPAIRSALAANLCRCTGYVKIIDAVEKVAKELVESGRTD